MIAIFRMHRSVFAFGLDLTLELPLLRAWHRLRIDWMANIPIATNVFRRMSSRKCRLGEFGSVFQDCVSIFELRLLVEGISPSSNFANLRSIFGRKRSIFQYPMNPGKHRLRLRQVFLHMPRFRRWRSEEHTS